MQLCKKLLVPAKPTAKLARSCLRSREAKQVVPLGLRKASPVTATQILEAKHESAASNAATHIGAPGGRTNCELNLRGQLRVTACGGNVCGCCSALDIGSSGGCVGPERRRGSMGQRQLDGSGGGAPQVLASGPARLDVGVFDGTHGWLRIRAELGVGGAVNASLTANAVAHDSLRAVLPEMAKLSAGGGGKREQDCAASGSGGCRCVWRGGGPTERGRAETWCGRRAGAEWRASEEEPACAMERTGVCIGAIAECDQVESVVLARLRRIGFGVAGRRQWKLAECVRMNRCGLKERETRKEQRCRVFNRS